MSKYTSQLRYICEAKSGIPADQIPETSIDDIIDAAKGSIFNFTFPIYDEAFRPVLEHEILFHFYLQEIGAETYGQWQYFLARKLREIMPYYNQLYLSAELDFNPFYDVDYTKTHGGRLTGNKQSSGTVNGHSVRDGSTTDDSTTDTSGSGSVNGSTSNRRVKDITGRDVTDSTTETDGAGTSIKDGTEETHTSSTNDGSGTKNATGTKGISNTYSKDAVSRDAYSDTPQTSVLGVEGDGSGNPTNNVSDNYYLTNYRKVTSSEDGQNTGSENTTNTETTGTHNSGTGSSFTTTGENVNTTSHSEGTGNTTVNKVGNETETNTGSTNESSITDGHSESSANGTSHDEAYTNSDSTGAEAYINTDDYTDRIAGKMGTASYSQMLQEYRETFLNINKMIFDELECLFMGIY